MGYQQFDLLSNSPVNSSFYPDLQPRAIYETSVNLSVRNVFVKTHFVTQMFFSTEFNYKNSLLKDELLSITAPQKLSIYTKQCGHMGCPTHF